jgi:hypothetical protein
LVAVAAEHSSDRKHQMQSARVIWMPSHKCKLTAQLPASSTQDMLSIPHAAGRAAGCLQLYM